MINCRYCNGPRKVVNKVCIGCGSPAANARRHAPKPQRSKCPCCGSVRSETADEVSFVCQSCGAELEREDFGFADDRPLENAMKRERRR